MNIINHLEEINPKNHEKYSENLYKWLKKNKNFLPGVNVYKNIKENKLYIGCFNETHDTNFWGAGLNAVLCKMSNDLFRLHEILISDFVVIENFWEDYIKIGRCAIDVDHTMSFLNSDNRWKYTNDGNTKSCTWCNDCIKWRKLYSVTELRSRWI